jgi:hypothetical protein
MGKNKSFPYFFNNITEKAIGKAPATLSFKRHSGQK